jgi:penicillin-binding protein 2
MATVSTASGDVINTYYKTEPKAGGDVTLTIDLFCQQAAEDALASRINEINREREAKAKDGEKVTLAEGGAVTVVKVGTGEVLALASYPTFNLKTFSDDYSKLLSDPLAPLYNRATQGAYSPGSTFKPVTAIAGLQEGAIDTDTKIYDKGIIDDYEGYTYKCWIYPGSHGNINVKEASRSPAITFSMWSARRWE